MRDMVRKGRQNPYDRRCERNPRAVMNPELIRQFRALRERGATLAALAQIFGIGTTQASRIARGEQWSEVA
jgi:hypothetical protein